MHGLEKGVNLLASQETNQQIRNKAIDQLNGVINDLTSGIEIWNQFIKSGNHSAKPGSFGGWAGFAMDNKLWELELEARAKARQASNGSSSLDEPLISQSNVKLTEGQNAVDCVREAVAAMEKRKQSIKSLIDVIKTTKPVKAAAAKTAPQAKSAVKKPAAAMKQSTQKKAAAKKPAKKQLAKKAPGKQKAAAAKKKAGKKKAAKKAAGKKATVKKKKTKKVIG
ncbi:MAG: hypothetical protein L0Z73_06780 [Gammaproteobacteria bacterium]|nr:hypothetical protein [Gammaproteobacteria bacterium]